MKNTDIDIFNFDLQVDYRQQFILFVDDLYESDITNPVDKIKQVNALTDSYVSTTSERPDPIQLDRLSTWILKGTEKANADSSFLTDRQLRRRVNDKEVLFYSPEIFAFSINNDGNRKVNEKPGMDSEESHKEYVRLPSDRIDMREFNGPLRKYFIS